MKKFILLSSLIFATNCFANPLQNFEQIKAAINEGKNVRIIIDYAKCSMTTGTKNTTMPSYTGAYTPNEIGINNDAGYVAASSMHFTLNNPQFPSKAIYEFVRYTISSDGSIAISLTNLDAANFTTLTGKMSFTCKMNESARIYAL